MHSYDYRFPFEMSADFSLVILIKRNILTDSKIALLSSLTRYICVFIWPIARNCNVYVVTLTPHNSIYVIDGLVQEAVAVSYTVVLIEPLR
jgi:hypothetical protein